MTQTLPSKSRNAFDDREANTLRLSGDDCLPEYLGSSVSIGGFHSARSSAPDFSVSDFQRLRVLIRLARLHHLAAAMNYQLTPLP